MEGPRPGASPAAPAAGGNRGGAARAQGAAGGTRDGAAPPLDPLDTEAQVGFLIRALGLRPGERVLDLGCGEGRHTLELRRRRFAAVGLDCDRRALRRARQSAKELDLQGPWLEGDLYRLGALDWPALARASDRRSERSAGRARRGEGGGDPARRGGGGGGASALAPPYPAAFQLFGPFGKRGEAEEDLALLQGVAALLEEGGRYAFDCVNREWILDHFRPQGRWRAGGTLFQEERRLDRDRAYLHTRTLRIWPDGRREEWEDQVRLHGLEELEEMLRQAGLVLQGLWGDFDFRPPGRGLRLVGLAVRRSDAAL